jgi:NADH-quinone oxidoreductase subunit K
MFSQNIIYFFTDNGLVLFNFKLVVLGDNNINHNFDFDVFLLCFLFVYVFGLFGVLFNVKNILISLLFVEIAYFGVVSSLLFLALFFNLVLGFIFALLVLLIAAAESVVGLGFVIVVFRFQRFITYNTLVTLQV